MVSGPTYCSFEEDRKGSVCSGKLADFIVLSDNPVKIDPLGIKDIQVLKTYVDGKVVHDVEGPAKPGDWHRLGSP